MNKHKLRFAAPDTVLLAAIRIIGLEEIGKKKVS